MNSLFKDKVFWKGFLSLAIPLALQNLLASSMSIIDTFMVSSQGETAVAAVGVCNQYTQLMLSWFSGLTAIGAMFIAQYWGAQDHKGIRRSYGLMISSLFAVGLFFTVFSMAAPELVMSIYTDNKVIQPVGVRYLRIMALSYIAQTMVFGISTLLRSVEKIRLPLISSVVAVISNTIMNWILIYGKFGIPSLGVEGAAIATVISSFANCFILIFVSIIKKEKYMWKLREIFSWDRSFLRSFTFKAAPILTNEVLYGTGCAIINIVLGRQAAEGIAALAVFRSFEGIFFSFFGGIVNAATVMIGKAVGSGELELGMRYAKRFAWLAPLLSTFICLFILCFSGTFGDIFSLSETTSYYLIMMTVIFTVACPFRMSNYIQNAAYRAGGQVVFGTIMEVVFLLFFSTPIVYLMGIVVKAPFLIVFASIYLEELVKLPIETTYTLRGKWLNPVTEEGKSALAAYHQKLDAAKQ